MPRQCPAGKAERQVEMVLRLQLSRRLVEMTQRPEQCSDVPYFMLDEPFIHGSDHWMKHHLNVEGETCYPIGEVAMHYIRETFAGTTTYPGGKHTPLSFTALTFRSK